MSDEAVDEMPGLSLQEEPNTYCDDQSNGCTTLYNTEWHDAKEEWLEGDMQWYGWLGRRMDPCNEATDVGLRNSSKQTRQRVMPTHVLVYRASCRRRDASVPFVVQTDFEESFWACDRRICGGIRVERLETEAHVDGRL